MKSTYIEIVEGISEEINKNVFDKMEELEAGDFPITYLDFKYSMAWCPLIEDMVHSVMIMYKQGE